MATIHDADVFVYHNENMESWVPKAAKGWKKGAPNVIPKYADLIHGGGLLRHGRGHGRVRLRHCQEVRPCYADVFVYHNENMESWVPKAAKGWKKGAPNVIKGTENMVLLLAAFGTQDSIFSLW
jgi:ABC-type Zn uptake system ZnuABC Zn-binding protein ZnuA